MNTDPLVFAGVCDWAGIVRGKGFPEADLETRLKKGVGLTHSNIMMSCFGPIYRHGGRSHHPTGPEDARRSAVR